eukprot:11203349-Lingulodinium_polyedra.AAC.1
MVFAAFSPARVEDFELMFPGEQSEHDPQTKQGQVFFRFVTPRLFGAFPAVTQTRRPGGSCQPLRPRLSSGQRPR